MDTTQLLKGVLDLAVLAALDGSDGYGYEVVRRLRESGLEEVGDASVYGTLRRLFQAGALTSYVEPSDEGPHRKYYAAEQTRPRPPEIEHGAMDEFFRDARSLDRPPGGIMTMTTHDRPLSTVGAAYLAAVGAALAGVADSDRQELLDDLAEHLIELGPDTDPAGLIQRLGSPEQYAAELLASAGIEPPTTTGAVRQRFAERVRAAVELFDGSAVERAGTLANDLRPGWWVLRAWLVLAALAARSGLEEALWIPNVTGSAIASPADRTLVDLAILAAAVVVSIRIGRGPKWAAWIATALGVLALLSVATANRSYFYRVDNPQPVSAPGVLTDPNGREIANIFAYDTSGKPIASVYLFDQDGFPVDVGNETAFQSNGIPFVSGRFPQPTLVENREGVIHAEQPTAPPVQVPQLRAPAKPATPATAKSTG